MVPPWDEISQQKTPEMNELETDKIFLKISAHNFEKQKSWSALKNIKRQDQTANYHFIYLNFIFDNATVRSTDFCAQEYNSNEIALKLGNA